MLSGGVAFKGRVAADQPCDADAAVRLSVLFDCLA